MLKNSVKFTRMIADSGFATQNQHFLPPTLRGRIFLRSWTYQRLRVSLMVSNDFTAS
jgi:hypothetical protein